MSDRPLVFVSDAVGFGGAELLLADLAAALAARGREVRVVVREKSENTQRLRARLGRATLGTAPLRHKSGYALRSLGATMDAPRLVRIAAALRALSPGAVVVNQADPEDGHLVAAAAGSIAPRPRIVGWLHCPHALATFGVERLVATRTQIARAAYSNLYDRVVTVSRASADEARARWAPSALVRGCANGIPLPDAGSMSERRAARSALGLVAGERAIAAIGRLHLRQKGFDRLIAAMPAILEAHPDARLLIAGDGPDRALLEAQIASLELEEKVRLLGWCAPRGLLLAADLLALPSHFEGLPLVLLEAGALGCDVVASDVGGIAEVLEESALVRPGDAAALGARICEALADEGLWRERGARLAARVRAHHSIEAFAARFLEAIA